MRGLKKVGAEKAGSDSVTGVYGYAACSEMRSADVLPGVPGDMRATDLPIREASASHWPAS